MDKKDANDLLKKVRKIEIRTRALSHQIFAGDTIPRSRDVE